MIVPEPILRRELGRLFVISACASKLELLGSEPMHALKISKK
jgi:hypothetical protein